MNTQKKNLYTTERKKRKVGKYFLAEKQWLEHEIFMIQSTIHQKEERKIVLEFYARN